MISSYVGENKLFRPTVFLAGELELEFNPGTWPSGSAPGGAGIPAFYTKTGSPLIAEGKEVKDSTARISDGAWVLPNLAIVTL